MKQVTLRTVVLSTLVAGMLSYTGVAAAEPFLTVTPKYNLQVQAGAFVNVNKGIGSCSINKVERLIGGAKGVQYLNTQNGVSTAAAEAALASLQVFGATSEAQLAEKNRVALAKLAKLSKKQERAILELNKLHAVILKECTQKKHSNNAEAVQAMPQ